MTYRTALIALLLCAAPILAQSSERFATTPIRRADDTATARTEALHARRIVEAIEQQRNWSDVSFLQTLVSRLRTDSVRLAMGNDRLDRIVRRHRETIDRLKREQAVESDPVKKRIYLLLEQNELDSAELLLKQEIPNEAEQHYMRGLIRELHYDLAEALNEYSLATQLDSLQPRYLLARAGIAERLGRTTEALQNFRAVRAHTPLTAALAASSFAGEGRLLRELGEPRAAQTSLRASLPLWQKAEGARSPRQAAALADLGLCYEDLNIPDSALLFFDRAETILHDNPASPLIATLLNNRGATLQHLGRYAEAGADHERAITIWDSLWGPGSPDAAAARGNLGAVWLALGDLDKAESCFATALTITDSIFGSDHPDAAIARNNLATLLRKKNRADNAIILLNQACTTWERTYGPAHPRLAVLLNNQGLAYKSLSRFDLAIESYRRALAIFAQNNDSTGDIATTTRSNLGIALYASGDGRSATEVLERALLDRSTLEGDTCTGSADLHTTLAGIYEELGQNRAATQHLRTATAIWQSLYRREHKTTP